MKDCSGQIFAYLLIKKRSGFFQDINQSAIRKKILKTKKEFAQRKRQHHDNNQIVSSFKMVGKKNLEKLAVGSLEQNQ